MKRDHPHEKILVGVILMLVGVVLIHYPWNLPLFVVGAAILASGVFGYLNSHLL